MMMMMMMTAIIMIMTKVVGDLSTSKHLVRRTEQLEKSSKRLKNH